MTDKKTILAIDDLPTQGLIYKAILGDQYNIRICKSAVEALELLNNLNVDMIITDIEMPEMTGFEFLQEKKKRANIREIPLIVASGYHDISEAAKYGANDFISKPVNPGVLHEKIKRLFEKGLNEKPQVTGSRISRGRNNIPPRPLDTSRT
ncbi:MAG: response regulator [Treponema sp.]|jgi:DNA-binding NtrC family response regulator|nr:response regulator [Treponema sp.]